MTTQRWRPGHINSIGVGEQKRKSLPGVSLARVRYVGSLTIAANIPPAFRLSANAAGAIVSRI
jgi:hypothetical protein